MTISTATRLTTAETALTTLSGQVTSLSADVTTLSGEVSGMADLLRQTLALLNGGDKAQTTPVEVTKAPETADKAPKAPPIDRKAPEAPKAPKAAKGILLTRDSLRDLKRSALGRAMFDGVSMADLKSGRVACPAGYRLPTGEYRKSIADWKAAQEA